MLKLFQVDGIWARFKIVFHFLEKFNGHGARSSVESFFRCVIEVRATHSLATTNRNLPAKLLLIVHHRSNKITVQLGNPLRAISKHLVTGLALVCKWAKIVISLGTKDLGIIFDWALTTADISMRHGVAFKFIIVITFAGNRLICIQLDSCSVWWGRNNFRYLGKLRRIFVSVAAYAWLSVLSQIQYCLLVINIKIKRSKLMLHQWFL